MSYEPRSARLYIRNTRLYSFAQIITYSPFVIYLYIQDQLLIPIFVDKWVSLFTQGLVNISGFVIVLIFIFAGPVGFERTSYHESEKDSAAGDSYSSITENV